MLCSWGYAHVASGAIVVSYVSYAGGQSEVTRPKQLLSLSLNVSVSRSQQRTNGEAVQHLT